MQYSRTVKFTTTKQKYKDLCYKEIMFDHNNRMVQKLTILTAVDVIAGTLVDMEPEDEYDVIVKQETIFMQMSSH
jgi:hypothetical protein